MAPATPPRPEDLPRCPNLDGSSLRIVPAYTEAGQFCEANAVTVTDGERTAVYVPAATVSSPDLFRPIVLEIYKAVTLLGGAFDLLGLIGSWGDSLDDEDVLSGLRGWNAAMTPAFAVGDRVRCRPDRGSWVDGKLATVTGLDVVASDGVWGHALQVDRDEHGGGITVVSPVDLEPADEPTPVIVRG